MVEYNTIASSFGNLSERIRKLQSSLLAQHAPFLSLNYPLSDLQSSSFFGHDYSTQLAASFSQTVDAYKKERGTEEVYVLLLIPEGERNTVD